MEILYIGKLCDDELFKIIENKQQPYSVAQYMYEKALCDELKKNKNLNINFISIYQTEYFPKDNFIFKRKKNKSEGFKYIKFINIPYLRELSYFISTCLYIIMWYCNILGKKDKCIFTSNHFLPVSLAVVLLSKFFSIKRIVTFTDLSLFTYSREKIEKMKFYKKLFIKPYISLVNRLQQSYNAYILFSKGMNQIVNPKNKPYIIMEGIFNNNNLDLTLKSSRVNSIAYAGTLNKEVGIDKILDVFSLIKDKNIELWLIGKGDMVNEIIEKSKCNSNIKYLGFMSRNYVFEKLKEAKLLINLRNPNDIYTKCSFPSKMFEYMVSGTPVLTTKLDGIPDEYYNYLFTVDNYLNIEIANKIVEILNYSNNEREKLGSNARDFILNNKNSVSQVKLITNFLFKIIWEK